MLTHTYTHAHCAFEIYLQIYKRINRQTINECHLYLLWALLFDILYMRLLSLSPPQSSAQHTFWFCLCLWLLWSLKLRLNFPTPYAVRIVVAFYRCRRCDYVFVLLLACKLLLLSAHLKLTRHPHELLCVAITSNWTLLLYCWNCLPSAPHHLLEIYDVATFVT